MLYAFPNGDGRDKTFQEIRENGAYFLANYDGLMARYPNQWVAIHGQRVAGAAADYFEAAAQLKAQGIAHNEALWEYMAADRNYYITSLWDWGYNGAGNLGAPGAAMEGI